MLVTHKTFDWSLTNRDLVIFMPNWGRGDYIRQTVQTIQTSIPRNRWIVIVANDRRHEDLSDLEEYNTYYFTFPHDDQAGRGDAFMRNIMIKYGQNQLLFQKDPEIIIEGDFIKSCLEHPDKLWRVAGNAMKIRSTITQKYMGGKATLQDCKQNCDRIPIIEAKHVFMHFGFCVSRQFLQDMHGYDEDYKHMYCADRDLWYRMIARGLPQHMNTNFPPIHLWHEVPWFPDTPENIRRYDEMKTIFANKNPSAWLRNPQEWGEGGM